MKKLLLSVAMLSFLGANAQTFGLKAGLNISNVSNLYESSTNSRTGFNAGAFVNLPLDNSNDR